MARRSARPLRRAARRADTRPRHPQEGEWLWRLADETEWHAPRPVEGNVARFIDQGGREAAILSLLEAIETRYPMADPEDPVDVLDESLTGTDPYAAPAAGPAR